MSPSSIRYEPEALDDIVAASQWYDGERSGLGSEFRRAVDTAARGLRDFPNSGAPVQGVAARLSPRQVRAHPFPYLVIYVVAEGDVRIVAVAHERRLPGYWLDRSSPAE